MAAPMLMSTCQLMLFLATVPLRQRESTMRRAHVQIATRGEMPTFVPAYEKSDEQQQQHDGDVCTMVPDGAGIADL